MTVDALLGLALLLTTLLFVLSAAIESSLEMVRGVLGITVTNRLKGAVSLDEALRQAADFTPANADLQVRLSAIHLAAKSIEGKAKGAHTAVSRKLAEIEKLTGDSQDFAGIPADKQLSVTKALADAADQVTSEISRYERSRIFSLRLMSIGLGVLISRMSEVDVVAIARDGLSPIAGGRNALDISTEWTPLGGMITGIAAASGSSFWHDKIDKIRSLKNINQQLAAIVKH